MEQSYDDSYNWGTGHHPTNSFVGVGRDSQNLYLHAGVRFNHLTIPPGAKIYWAYLDLYAYGKAGEAPQNLRTKLGCELPSDFFYYSYFELCS